MDVLAAAARAVGRPLTAGPRLAGSDRTRVVRATVDGGSATMVVKSYRPEFTDHWARESGALSVLSGHGLPVPELLAVADDPPLVVLADLGEGPSLADALLDGDAATATTRLHQWVDALAALHRATAGETSPLASAARAKPSIVDSMPDVLAGAADLLGAQLAALDIADAGPALAELRTATAALSPGATALSPADACPDNNVDTPSGLVLLDFEQAAVRHVAWDAAYLVLPWPSCWCAWGLPAEVAATALARWRAAVAPSIPAVRGAAFARDLDVAVVAWAFLSTAWFLPAALNDAPNDAGRPPGRAARGPTRRAARGPTRRAVIQHRLRLAAHRPTALPALAVLATRILTATRHRWGDLPLPPAPAYRPTPPPPTPAPTPHA